MLLKLLIFELKYHSSRIIFRTSAAVFFLLGLLMSRSRMGYSNLFLNNPLSVSMFTGILSLGTVITIALFAGNAILRDREHHMEGLIFTSRINHGQFVVSRFLGLVFAGFLSFSLAVVGLFLGLFLPGIQAAEIGPVLPVAYLWNLVFIGLPNVLIGCSIIFATAALARSAMATYISGVFLYVLYWTGSMLGNSPLMANSQPMEPHQAALAALLEPYGLVGLMEQTRYWSIAEKNHQLLQLEGPLLMNRLLWVGFSLCLFALTYRFFSFRQSEETGKKRDGASEKSNNLSIIPAYIPLEVPTWGRRGFVAAWWAHTGMMFRLICRSLPFYALLLIWTFLMLVTLTDQLRSGPLGVPIQPLTSLLAPVLLDPLQKFGVLILVFFTAEVLWQERTHRFAALLDAGPSNDSVFWAGKLIALSLVAAALVLVSLVLAMLVQFFSGHGIHQPGLYSYLFLRTWLTLVFAIAFAFLIQTLVPNKYGGLALSFLVLILFSGLVLSQSPLLENPILRLGYLPEFVYSAMAGMEYYREAVFGYLFFWGCVAGLAAAIALRFWPRGLGPGDLRAHSRLALAIGSLMLMVLASGGLVYYKTHIAQTYRSAGGRLDWSEQIERSYAQDLDVALPEVTAIQMEVNLYPKMRSYEVIGQLTFENRTQEPLQNILLHLPLAVNLEQIQVDNGSLISQEQASNHFRFTLASPIQPGGNGRLSFGIKVETNAWKSLNSENYVLPDMSYVEVDKVLPTFGVNTGLFIQAPMERRKRGLAPRTPLPPAGSQPALDNRVAYDVTISTVVDQSLVAPGKLVRSWQDDSRRFFQFSSEGPISSGFAFASAPFESRSLQVGEVTLTSWFYGPQGQNVDRLLAGAEAALTTFQQVYGPYPDKHLNLVQVSSFSDSFAATAYPNCIFVVENRLFTLDLSGQTLDIAYLTMAHEVAHQWWAHQLSPVTEAGCRLLTEIPAIYSELMLARQQFGAQYAGQYIDLTRDQYFFQRGFEQGVEYPLAQGQNQSYVTYFKGAHLAHVLFETMGEDTVNKILAELLGDYPPGRSARAATLVDRLLEQAPPEYCDLINELLTQVVTYDLKIIDARLDLSTPNISQIELSIQATAIHLDEKGQESLTFPVHSLEIGFWKDDQLVETRKVFITSRQQSLVLATQYKPDQVSLDPRKLFLDLETSDNHRILVDDPKKMDNH